MNRVCSASCLKNLNPFVDIRTISETNTEENISELVFGSDLIVDASDNLRLRYILNRAAIRHGLPLFHGAVNGFEGRVTTILPDETACLRCLYPKPVPVEKFPVIGVAPAVIGAIQATEVIKYLIRSGRLLTNRMLMYDGSTLTFNEFKIKKNPQCDHCGKNY